MERGDPQPMSLKKTLAPVFFYTSNLTGPYQAAAFVLCCFDARFRHVFDAFIRHVGFEYIDVVSVAGGGKILASPEEASDRAFLLREIATSRQLHNTQRVLVMTHRDCGAYGGETRFQGDEEEEFTFHTAEHAKARAVLTAAFPDMRVETFFLDTHGVYRTG
jgi:carbonic anhydrase